MIDISHSEQLSEIGAALAKAQSELTNPKADANNPYFSSKYADLAGVLNVVRPVFSKYGLSITQYPGYYDGKVYVKTFLLHSSGQYISSEISSPVVKQKRKDGSTPPDAPLNVQDVGSVITYCRRYALAAISGIAQEDDDGNAAAGNNINDRPKHYEKKSPTKGWEGLPATNHAGPPKTVPIPYPDDDIPDWGVPPPPPPPLISTVSQTLKILKNKPLRISVKAPEFADEVRTVPDEICDYIDGGQDLKGKDISKLSNETKTNFSFVFERMEKSSKDENNKKWFGHLKQAFLHELNRKEVV